jgi:hypothetical protein
VTDGFFTPIVRLVEINALEKITPQVLAEFTPLNAARHKFSEPRGLFRGGRMREETTQDIFQRHS